MILRIDVKPGSAQEFEAVWRKMAGTVSLRPENLDQWLLRGTEDDTAYFVVTDWTDEASFREFEHSAEHLGHRAALAPFRRGGWMETTQVAEHVTGTR
ncbi:heme-degrading monooxygenase HmoA [Kibdelosporangium banguiense]|uniref:Heme-degrading monooxygenase HmoA n=1 Tax=Kibdelosporangium banguiense TaxID=1365924 RepID=A0ABS4TFD7_9PSEU|nr:heme-degrading monooxygenase HmoA [Kibdelosporangium banguiense]